MKYQMKTLLKAFCALIVIFAFSSCQKDERMLKKFVSRYNAEEYDASSAYIYDGDLNQLAFFTQEVKNKNKHAFLKIKDSDYDGDNKSLTVTFKWENVNETMRNYFASIGHPLAEDGSITEIIKVVETTDGDKLAFNWGLPLSEGNKLRIAGMYSENEEVKAVNIRQTPDGTIIGELHRGDKIFADKAVLQDGSYPVYWINDNGGVEQGFIKAKLLSLSESPYFSMGILDSMGVFIALIIAAVILLPLLLLRALFTNPILALVGIALLFFCLYIFYQCIEKIIFELFIINLPY